MDTETKKINCQIAQNEVSDAYIQADYCRERGFINRACKWQREASKWHREVWFWLDALADKIKDL